MMLLPDSTVALKQLKILGSFSRPKPQTPNPKFQNLKPKPASSSRFSVPSRSPVSSYAILSQNLHAALFRV